MFQIPRGTRDFNPEEMKKRKYVEEKMRKTFKNFGYKEIQTPTFENLDLFTVKSGEEIIDEIYTFKDKGGRDLALRPELTAPAIRFYVEKLQMDPKPLKLFYFGNCFRYDRPQKGRYREFTQAGCELIGTDNPEALAELIALSYKIIRNIGLKEIKLKIGNLKILKIIFEKYNLMEDQQKYITPLIDKEEYEEIKNALRDFNKPEEIIKDFVNLIKTSDMKKIKSIIEKNEKAKKEYNKLIEISDYLKNCFEITDFKIDIGIVRGLDYYTDIVFEIEAPVLSAEKQICGGGSYKLVSLFGGKETPTAGFAVGFDRTIVALNQKNKSFPKESIDYYIIPINENLIKESLTITQKLRRKGYSADIDLKRRGIKKALKYANSIDAKKSIIIGPDEIEKNSLTIKDMKTGNQKTEKINDLVR